MDPHYQTPGAPVVLPSRVSTKGMKEFKRKQKANFDLRHQVREAREIPDCGLARVQNPLEVQ